MGDSEAPTEWVLTVSIGRHSLLRLRLLCILGDSVDSGEPDSPAAGAPSPAGEPAS